MLGPTPAPSSCGSPTKAGAGGTPPESSLVHPLETKSPAAPLVHLKAPCAGRPEYDQQPILPEESAARHSPYVWRRFKAWESLNRLHSSTKRLASFANCGSGAWLEVSSAKDDLRIRCNRCHDRWCPACATERAAKINGTLSDHVAGRPVRFYTFTLRHSDTPLKAQIDRLYRSFATLRRRKDFIAHCRGGCAFFEAKISEKSGRWHPHLHVIIEGVWWDQREISAAWHAVTGDSSIVDVRAMSDTDGTVRYVTKYVTKPAHESVYLDTDKFDELVSCLSGRRLAATFGTWRGLRLNDNPVDPGEWQPIAPLADLNSRANSGDAEALRFRTAAARRWPLLAVAYGWPPAPA